MDIIFSKTSIVHCASKCFYWMQTDRDGSSSRFVHTKETLESLAIGDVRAALANQGCAQRMIPFNAVVG